MWRCILIGVVSGVAVTMAVIAFGAGIFWLWVFGDDVWPNWAKRTLTAGAFLAGLAVLTGFVVVGYRRNRH